MTSSPTQTALIPGYKHVENFGPDDEYEDEEEECYVTLDLGSVDQTLVPSSPSYRLIGLDTPTPFLQLSGTIMKGHYQTLIGTELLFKDVPEEAETSSSQRQNNVRYFTKTDRRILFREVELKPKTADDSSPQPQQFPRKKKHSFFPILADEGADRAIPTKTSHSTRPETQGMELSAPEIEEGATQLAEDNLEIPQDQPESSASAEEPSEIDRMNVD